jgi:hypothetical protein
MTKLNQWSGAADNHSASQKVPRLFKKLEVSLLLSQGSDVGSLPWVSYTLSLLTPLRLGLSSYLFSSRFPLELSVHFLRFPCMIHVPPLHSPRFDCPNSTWWRIKIMKFLTVKCSQPLCCVQVLSEHSFPQHPPSLFSPQIRVSMS